jgi:mannose-1-phosphate guanylyltransferase
VVTTGNVSSIHAVILAGGSGTRFWPASRRARPKQLLPLAGSADESLIAATVRRIGPIVAPEQVWISTSTHLLDATAAALPGVPRAHLLAEPVPRNTAPCIGLAAATIARTDPDAVVMVLPADHFISDEPEFRRVLRRAVATADDGWLTTIGIRPTRPDTGYGYIELGPTVAEGVHSVARFVEKPTRERAEGFLATGQYVWNAGMFFFRASVMLEAMAKHLPAVSEGLRDIDAGAAHGDEAGAIARVFPHLPSISIDYGVMEKAERIAVVPGSFGWNDVGSWQVAWEMSTRDADGNAAPPGTIAIDARNNLVTSLASGPARKRVALVGVSDMVVVETDDALLVIPRERAQDVRLVVDVLVARGETDKL